MHFPVEVLRDKIKDLFEKAVPKHVHMDSFEWGLSHALRYHQEDLPVGQSAEIDQGFEKDDPIYKTFFHIYDNFVQFFWMLVYSAYVDHDAALIALTTEDAAVAEAAVVDLRCATKVYREAILMLETSEKDAWMKASRGKLFELPNPYNNRNPYCDKVDTIVVAGCAYLLLHEYGHFHYNHESDTPANEIQADLFALNHLLDWAMIQPDGAKTAMSVLLGVVFTLIAAAYRNPKLVSTSYPDIDKRIILLVEHAHKYSGVSLANPVKRMLWIAISSWIKTNNVADLTPYQNLPVDEQFDRLIKIITQYKQKF